MEIDGLLDFEPRELNFTYKANRQLSSEIRLENRSGNTVAFKLLSTRRGKYSVQPHIGILPPGSSFVITVKTQAPKEVNIAMRSMDKFMIQSIVARPGTRTEDARNLFKEKAYDLIQVSELNVVFSLPTAQTPNIPANNPAEFRLPRLSKMDIELAETPIQASCAQNILEVKPAELQFPLKLEKELSRSFQLSNTSNNHVAFMVKTTNGMYFIQPNCGIVLPQSTFDVTVKLQEQDRNSLDVKREDKFLIQNLVTGIPVIRADMINQEMFDDSTSTVQECEVRVVYELEEEKGIRPDELIITGIITLVVGLVIWYLVKHTLALIWSLVVLIPILMVKTVKKFVSESLEDWIVTAVYHIVSRSLFKGQGRGWLTKLTT